MTREQAIKILADHAEKSERGQTSIALKLGVTKAMVSYILSGDRRPGRDLAAKIAKLYRIPVAAWNDKQPKQPETRTNDDA